MKKIKYNLPVFCLALLLFSSCKKDNLQISKSDGINSLAKTSADEFIVSWLVSYGGTEKYTELQSGGDLWGTVRLGIFRGNNKKTDVLNEQFHALSVSYDGIRPKKGINRLKTGLEDHLLGDFNGDGITDLFYADGKFWWVCYSGKPDYIKITRAIENSSKLKLGDFDGNGKADVFYADGNVWWVFYNGKGSYQFLNEASETTDQLQLGDFDGNGKTDVFCADGETWRVAYDDKGRYQQINEASETTDKLQLGDFDGNGKTDVFYADGEVWKVAYDGKGRYQQINEASETTDKLLLGDFNGDKKTDVFYQRFSF